MDRTEIVAALLTTQGSLILVVAGIHLAVSPLVHRFVADRLAADKLDIVWPPFELSFVVMGVLLIPVGLSAIYCARGIRRREGWAWTIAMINALAVLSLPVAQCLIMNRVYFEAVPFLVASILITVVGVSMVWPLLGIRPEMIFSPGKKV